MSGKFRRTHSRLVWPRQTVGSPRIAVTAVAAIATLLPAVMLANQNEDQVPSMERPAATSSVVTDGPIRLSVEIDKPVARVAETIQLIIQVDAPRGTRIKMPILSDHLGSFDVLTTEQADALPIGRALDDRRWILHATLETIKTGDLRIPPLNILYAIDSNSTAFESVQSEPLDVRIASVLENRADATNFRDIKDVVDIDMPETRSYAWLWWTLGGAVSVGTLALLALFVAQRKRLPSPAKWALAEVSRLEEQNMRSAAGAEAMYDEVVEVVREFVELQFDLPARCQTTPDFLTHAARGLRMSDTAREQLQTLLAIADEVKFARLEVGEEQLRRAFYQAKQFVVECERVSRDIGKEAA